MEFLSFGDNGLWIRRYFSFIGGQSLQFAFCFYLFLKTGSAMLLALLLMISILPHALRFHNIYGGEKSLKKFPALLEVFYGCLISGFFFFFQRQEGVGILWIFILVILLEIEGMFFGQINEAELARGTSQKWMGLLREEGSISLLLAAALYALIGMQGFLRVGAGVFLLLGLSAWREEQKKKKKSRKMSRGLYQNEVMKGTHPVLQDPVNQAIAKYSFK